MTYFLTTAIDYVNAAPHLGHAYEKVAADVIARYQRLLGNDVFFLTGTDEHGLKVQKTAATQGKTPKEYTDSLAASFQQTWELLGITYDRFIRTTDADHYDVVAQLWQTLAEKGDIYKAAYTGLYCLGCENFLNPRDLTEAGECPIHLTAPEPVAEENYFFRLTRYKDAIKAHIEATPGFILPAYRAQEVLNVLDEMEDISVSRSEQSVSWGIPVPGDPSQRIYVWIDALSNYLTGVGYGGHHPERFQRYWPANLHLIGKDILRFHAIYWPAMLLAAGLPLPQTIFAHGFINLNDAKISKSLGNVVAPADLMQRFDLPDADAIRYYLMTVARFGADGNFTEDDFKLRVNADLANNLGNLLNRTLTMCGKYCEGHVPAVTEFLPIPGSVEDIRAAYDSFAFDQAVELILARVDAANKLINDTEPWKLFKEGQTAQVAKIMATVLEVLRQTAILLSPVTPKLCSALWVQLGQPSSLEAARWQDVTLQPLTAGQALNPQGPLFLRLDSEIVGSAKKR